MSGLSFVGGLASRNFTSSARIGLLYGAIHAPAAAALGQPRVPFRAMPW
jgi:hypothetical protein